MKNQNIDDILSDSFDESSEVEIVDLGSWKQFRAPVSINFLANVFRLDKQTVKKRIAELEPCGKSGNFDTYDFVEAAPYLVKPKIDAETLLRTMKTQDLPLHLRKEHWAAMRQRQIYEEHAGDLWRTNDVVTVLGELFSLIRNSLMTFDNVLEKNTIMTAEHRKVLKTLLFDLQEDIYQKILELPEKTKTPSSIKEEEFEDGSEI